MECKVEIIKTQTATLKKAKIVWICCDPLPPIPLDINQNKQLVLGRNERADLQLPHKCVSRRHAQIRSISSRCLLLEDLGSSNGTFVNGKKITAYPLQEGDVVTIGPFELEIRNQPFNNDSDSYNSTNTEFLTTSHSAAMAGQLEKTSLIEILQTIEFHSKTGTLFVDDKKKDGFFVFAKGTPISAQFGDLQNEKALMAMLKLKKGSFILTDTVEPIEGSFHQSITCILLEFSRTQDEI